jgi:hypothetical protein
VADPKLLSDNNDINDEEVPKSKDINEGGNVGVCLQFMDPDLGWAPKPVPAPLEFYIEPPSEASAANMDPLFNAIRKSPPLDAIIVKQEAGFFQSPEEKR